MRRFEGKTALVTGGGRDIGRACALRLAKEGARVAIVCMRSTAAAEAVVREIEGGGGEALLMRADLTTDTEAAGVAERVEEVFGTLDAVIHNTGGMIARRTLAEMDSAFWREVMDVNLTSLFLTARSVLPLLAEGSAIVTMASQAGRDGGGPGAVAYATSKGAVMTFTRGLAKELGPRTRVNAICPGMIDTTFHDTFTRPEARSALEKAAPLRRQGRPEDVAALAAFLASGDAAYVTGACFDVNGGMLLS